MYNRETFTQEQRDALKSYQGLPVEERMQKLREMAAVISRPYNAVCAKYYLLARPKDNKGRTKLEPLQLNISPVMEEEPTLVKVRKKVLMTFDMEFDFANKKLLILG